MNITDLKKSIKAVPGVQALLDKKNIHKAAGTIINNARKYQKAFLENSTSYPEKAEALYYRREVIIGAHILEKGLSHSDFRPGFGRKAIINLQINIQKYMNMMNPDDFALRNAISLLRHYHDLNQSYEFDDSDYVDTSLFDKVSYCDLKPYNLISKAFWNMTFNELAHSRHSVRCYEGEGLEIKDDEIKEVIALANTAPSACNRQATHIFVIKDKEVMNKLEILHGGCKNFGGRASLFLLVTSDLSLYSRNEVKIPPYDAGIYSMNLLYALQTKGFYSCILNGSFPGAAYDKVHELTTIPERYDVNGLIAVYKLDNARNIRIAASPRRDAEDVVTIL